jgi:hypothetical protein
MDSDKHILVRTTICNSMGCTDIRAGTVQQFQLINNCLRMALQGANMLQFNVILMAFKKERLWDGNE